MLAVQCQGLQINSALSQFKFFFVLLDFFIFFSALKAKLWDAAPDRYQQYCHYSRYMAQMIVLAVYITEHQNIKFSNIMGPVTRV